MQLHADGIAYETDRRGGQRLAEDPSTLVQKCRPDAHKRAFAQPRGVPNLGWRYSYKTRRYNLLKPKLLLCARIRICAFDDTFLRRLAALENSLLSRCPPQHAIAQLPREPRNGLASLWSARNAQQQQAKHDTCLTSSNRLGLHLGRHRPVTISSCVSEDVRSR